MHNQGENFFLVAQFWKYADGLFEKHVAGHKKEKAQDQDQKRHCSNRHNIVSGTRDQSGAFDNHFIGFSIAAGTGDFFHFLAH